MPSPSQPSDKPRSWIRSVGPGLVTACAVIGPGSILISSKIGAEDGYSRFWIIILSVLFMLTYTTLAAKLAVVSQSSTGDLIRKYAGKGLAILIGVCVFFISAAFQFGNNLGVHSALSAYAEFDYWVIPFNALALIFIFGFHNLYKTLERAMACFVGLMLLSFAINLFFARPELSKMAAGFIPSNLSEIGLPFLGLIGTTFAITAAYYQSYLVRFKGWRKEDLKSGLIDARVSAIVMASITLMIMATAAAVFGGKNLSSVSDIANQLEPLFGEKGRAIFCSGLFAAAFSSFIVGSMIGGFVLSDSLNLGSSPENRWPRILTAAVLIIGMLMSLYIIKTGIKPISAIIAAQAVTVLAAPLIAGVMLWLTNQESIMGDQRNGLGLNLAAGAGFLLLIAISLYTATQKVWPALTSMFS